MKFIYEDNTSYFYGYSLLEGIQKDFKELHGDKLFTDFMSVRDKLEKPYNDMSYWMRKSSEELEDFLSKVEIKKSNSEVRREEKQDAELVYQVVNVKLYFITTYEAMKYYGKGTKWCIAGNYPGHEGRGQEYFDSYIRDNNLDGGYYVLTDGKDKYCVLISNKKIHSIWNAEDDQIKVQNLPQKFIEALAASEITDSVKEFVIRHGVLKKFNNIYNKTEIEIPNDVTSIGEGAFYDCSGLVSIAIPSGVTSIGGLAFTGCTELTSVMIPGSVTSISGEAFSYCTGLTSVTIGKGVTSIGSWVFYKCNSLTSISIPGSVTSISSFAFGRCKSLSDVYYSGSEKDWDNIYIDSGNNYLLNANIHFNSRIKNERLAKNNMKFILESEGTISRHESDFI